jgi:multiple sugar transport system substrate-binding protein
VTPRGASNHGDASVRDAILVGLSALALLSGCSARRSNVETLRFWAMGREGEVVQELATDFERENPGIHIIVQQLPWSAAHEKLLTAYVGGSTPDVGQLGNTWIPEFAALRAIEPLDARIAATPSVPPAGYFRGIWDTNVVDGVVYGVPWYVDTRLLFYRRDLLARAGWKSVPENWRDWVRCMEDVKRAGAKTAIFLPTNEYTPWIIFGLQAKSRMLKDEDTRGDFSGPGYRKAASFYMDVLHRHLAPTLDGNAIGNVYQEFERGTFAMYITGPWQLGEFRNRLSPAMQSSWATAPLPGPDGPESGVSTAGGSSLVLFRNSRHPEAAWKWVEFLSRPEQQLRFWRLTGDLPARQEAWRDTALTRDPNMRSFGIQLERTVATPNIPEWEEIAVRLRDDAVPAMVLGHANPDSTLRALDRAVDRILEKRRWLIERERARRAAPLGVVP